jgi:DNA-directed RNA polymerase beta' subunit
MLSPEEIRRNSVVEVKTRDTYVNNKPLPEGLFDPRMGVLEPGLICPTDGLTYIDNPGYFGHIELARPVLFIQHIKDIMKISKCVCFKCSKLLINKNQHKHILEYPLEKRWSYIAPIAAKIRRCGESIEDGCGCKQPDKIRLEGFEKIYAVWENISTENEDGTTEVKKVNMRLTPEIILKIFRRISDEDISFMGFSPTFSRPEWMICQVLPVPPPAVRPSVKLDAQQRSEDDLTHIYSNIIKTNRDLFDKLQKPDTTAVVIDGLTSVLQYLVAMIVNNKIKGAVPMAQRSGRPLQCIMGRLNSKNGRIRGNLMGKRVDFSARSVITGDPNVSIYQLGVPLKIAKNLTKPMKVNDRNRDFLMKLVQNGPDIHPGAKNIERKNGEFISLRYVDINSIRLENGDIVHRHMMDGDAVLFNRQPSLHRMSMMCHIVKIMKQGDSFRMNICNTKPYNADFDGDEMNMHLPQNILAETELRHLAAIPYQMISPSGNAPVIGIYQDSLLGSFRFTRPNIKLTPREMMNLLMLYTHVDVNAILENKEQLTSFDVLSQILGPLTMKYKTKLFDDNEDMGTSNNVLEIRGGKYIRGQIEKSVLGASTKGIVHRMFNDFGPIAAADFIDDLQNIINEYMKTSSFSVGVSDLIANKKTQDQIIKIISDQKMEVQSELEKLHLGIFENDTSNTNMVQFETNINNILNKATEQAGKEGRKSLSKDNRFLMIVNSGSKGNLVNISQMISCVGQTNVDGKRISYGFNDRTLPHYKKFDDSPAARGFIENSYISGLTAPELFFHAMGGRIGLIDTAVKSVTWETPIVIIENDKPKYIEIGKWIDGQLDSAKPEDVQHFTERRMELMNTDSVYIPTTDEDGNVTWGEITAITRHDPGTELYEIKTSGGRSVIVTESKSLLIWNPETKKLKEMLTPDIKVGDCVPVTEVLCKPPIVLDTVDMSDYLPKDKYVYGSEFNRAIQLMNQSMSDRKKIPAGWWNQHNGKTFTLPYTKKASLQRANIRSNIDNIQSGYIYPYHAQRTDTCIPDTFELNEENGIFIGLLLAEGHCDSKTVSITNNNVIIQEFVEQWFDKHSITHSKREKVSGTYHSTSIIGNSSVLSTFLKSFVGHKAENKHIPTEAYIANESFVKGLLNGYYSGDGSISKNSIDVSSASKRLIEGIGMLCSRFGIFGKVSMSQIKTNNFGTKNIKPSYRMRISAQWGKLFSENISLLEETKNNKMKAIQWRNRHMNFKTYNNVVLDEIVEINILDTAKYPKVYDLTIPSTLNFGLANGLQVRDTSTTGYIQRRLIKGLEDLKVEYDMTVRNNRGKIIQFKYGDDGFDSTKAENQAIPLVGMSVEDVYLHYDIAGINDEKSDILRIYTKGTVTRMKKQQAETMKKNKIYIDKMLDVRELIVKNIFKYKNENTVKVPVAFQNIIANIQGQLGLNSHSITDITPLEAYELIEDTFETIKQLLFAPPTPLFEILYYYYLSPRDLLVNKRFHRKGLQLLLETIVLKYKQALVHPGEMVGVIAGQSIGEPTTQLTLNSVTYETEIVVRNQRKEIKKVQIGDFVKEHIEKSKQIQYMEDKDTTYAELSQEEYYEVPSADEEGHTLWTRIEAVTKHPVINEDGSNTMLKLTTKGCREVIVTRAKSSLQLIDGKIQGIDSKDLKVGDYLPVSKKPLEYQSLYELDLRTILPQNEYLYGGDYKKAKEVMNEHHWWNKHSGKTFVLPHSRSDSFVDLTKTNKNIDENCVYMKMINNCEYKVPDKIQLDYDFGYLVGAYCAEGCMTKHQISIANNDLDYLRPIERLCEKWNINTKIYKTANKIQEGWTSQDIRIYNTVLCRILDTLCGKLSHNKFVSDKIVFSNPQCIMGFLDAYIGGDGCVKKCSQSERIENISACSVSKTMLTDIMVMLKNMDIVATMNKPRKIESNNRGSKNIRQTYMLTIRNKQAQKLAHMLHLPIHSKGDRIHKLMDQSFIYEYDKAYLTVPNKINGETVMEPRNDRFSDILFDQIVSIEEVPNTTPYAYDLTVEITRNFDCYNGLCENDTFHMAGVASKSNVTRGVPRIEEILRLTDNPKNPSLTIHLKPIDELDKDRATVYANMLEHTRLVDVVKSIQICFDPLERSSFMEEDKGIIDQFYEFEDMLRECMEDETNPAQKSKWIIRMELDAETLLDKNITMDDVHFAIKNVNPDIHCVYSDYNESNLVFRIRMNSDSLKKKKGAAFTLDQSDEIYLLKNFQDNLLNNIVLRGIHGIDNVLPRKVQNMVVKEEGKYVRKDIWILDTTGTNLLDVLGTDFIDGSRTYGNDIQEIFDVLGIEAARQIIFNEFVEVMEFSDVYINYHHLSLLCDRMTVTQKMVAIFRSGLHNDNIGPIAKATFEVHTEILLNAARHADFDEMRGVSANVMCGQHGYYGTGAFNVILDMKEISKLADADVTIRDDDREIERMFGKMEDTAEVCARNSIVIRNNISAIHSTASEAICQDNYDMGF